MKLLDDNPNVPRVPVVVIQNASDNETTSYTDKLFDLIKAGGFGGATDGGTDFAGNTMQGVPEGISVAVAVHRSVEPPPAAALLLNALKAANIPAVGIVPQTDLSYFKPGGVLLFVTERR